MIKACAGTRYPSPFPSVSRDSRVTDEPACLSDDQLLGQVLGAARGVPGEEAARSLLSRGPFPELVARRRELPWPEALSRAQTQRLEALLELADRVGDGADPRFLAIKTPRDAYEAVTDLRTARKEHFLGLYLNARHRLLARETVSVGSLNASIVHPREVFEPALRHGAASIVVVHNHPSGETDPSDDDLCITRRLAEAGEILGVPLVDHVIVGRSGFTSLREAGHL